MGDGAGGLSDALRRMAEGDHGRKRPQGERPADRERMPAPPAGRPVSRKPSEPEDARVKRPESLAVVEATPRAAAGKPRPPAPPAHDGLKAAAVPICLTTATLLLIPATWAILLLAGVEVWRSDWPGARSMALAMLACLPLALALIGGAWALRRHA